MARTFAQVKVTIWDDPDFVALDQDAQRLYFLLMTRADTSMAGVVTWHPGRLAQLAKDTTARDIVATAEKLARARFIIIDRETDECLLRTFVRHDEALRRGMKTAGGVVSGWRAIYSHRIKTVVAHGVADEHALTEGVLAVVEPLLDWASASPLDAPDEDPQEDPNQGAYGVPSGQPTTNNQQPTTSSPPAKPRGQRIPDDFAVTESMREWAKKSAPHCDIDRATENFIDYWSAKSGNDASKLDWVKTWRTWMRRESDRTPEWKRSAAPTKPLSTIYDSELRPFEGDPNDIAGWQAWQTSERQRIRRERGEVA